MPKGGKTRVRVGCELSDEFEVKLAMHQGSVLSTFLLAGVVVVVIELIRDGVLSELLHADDLPYQPHDSNIFSISFPGKKCLTTRKN